MIQGSWDSRFHAVVDAFASNFSAGREVGAAACVVVDNRTVVDVWGGSRDRNSTRAWRRDTPTVVFSCSKALTALVALRAADRGILDLDGPVSQVWPEFADQGKDLIPLAMMLSHTAGLPALSTDVTIEQANDDRAMAGLLARQAPAWEPGTNHGYHGLTYGWLIGEVVRRATHQSVGEHLRRLSREIHTEAWIGAPPSVRQRTAHLHEAEHALPADRTPSRFLEAARDPDGLAAAAMLNPPLLARAHHVNRDDVLAAEWPAVNAIATARGLAHIMHATAIGRLLAEETLQRATSVVAHGPDLVLQLDSAFGLGFMLPSAAFSNARPGSFGHTGAGGSRIVGDHRRRFGFGYVTNLWGPDPLVDDRADRLLEALYDCVS